MRKVFIIICASVGMLGCASPGGRRYFPDRQSWQSATINAATHPATWAPLVGAGIIAVGGWDRELSDWARKKTPVFGSEERASDQSDLFRSLSIGVMHLAAASIYDEELGYWLPLAQRTAVGIAGPTIAVSGFRKPISRLTDRDRPNRQQLIEEGNLDGGLESFPSGHATYTFACVGIAYRNIEAINLPVLWEYSAKTLNTCLGYTVAWARVEAGAHYPTDVLAGAALGNFISLLLHDAFLGRENRMMVQFTPDRVPVVSYSWSF